MSALFYGLAAVMVVVAAVVVSRPLLRGGHRLLALGCVAAIAVASAAFYPTVSNYEVRSTAMLALAAATTETQARTAADALAAELRSDSDNYAGWRLLGQARVELQEFGAAAAAFRQALALQERPDPELKIMLGEALSYDGGRGFQQEARELFIAAYAEAPDNPRAQWFAGLAYAAQGQRDAAVSAWTALLDTGPPPEIARILRQQIAVLNGEATTPAAGADASATLSVEVALADSLRRDQWPPAARLFVSVRDADQGGPPLAARQFPVSALPLTLQLGDADAMVAGRTISAADNVVVTARIALNGDPLGASGDLVGSAPVSAPFGTAPVRVAIDEVAP